MARRLRVGPGLVGLLGQPTRFAPPDTAIDGDQGGLAVHHSRNREILVIMANGCAGFFRSPFSVEVEAGV